MSTYNETAFIQDAVHYRTIPLIQSYFVDTLTPIQIFQALKNDAVYLLESNDEHSPWSKYSFIGLNPFITIEEKDSKLHVLNKQKEVLFETLQLEKAVDFVKSHLRVKELDHAIPFRGGAVGYIGYDAVTTLEKIPTHPNDDLQLKKYHLLYCETIIIFSHLTKEMTFIHYSQLTGKETREELTLNYNQSLQTIDQYVKELMKGQNQHESLLNPKEFAADFSTVKSNYDKETFINHVDKVKEYIKSGDVFQTVLSQRFEIPISSALSFTEFVWISLKLPTGKSKSLGWMVYFVMFPSFNSTTSVSVVIEISSKPSLPVTNNTCFEPSFFKA